MTKTHSISPYFWPKTAIPSGSPKSPEGLRLKNLGQGQQRECEMGPEGAILAPSAKYGPGRRASEGPYDPLADKTKQKQSRKGGVHSPRARAAPPGPHSGEGLVRPPPG